MRRPHTHIIARSFALMDMLPARLACRGRVEPLDLIDLEALWRTRQDEKLKKWANGQEEDDLAAQLVNFKLSILEAEDITRLEERFRSLLPRVAELRATFTSLSDADLLKGFKRNYAMIIAVLQRPDLTVNDLAKTYDNMRDLTPPAILLANRLVRGC